MFLGIDVTGWIHVISHRHISRTGGLRTEYKTIKIGENDSMASITLDRPPCNAMNVEMMTELSEALTALRESKCKLLIIRANGTFFSTGLDIIEHLDRGTEDILRVYHSLISNLMRISCPVVALVDGPALGAGFELAVLCEMVIASEAAEFGLPQVRAGIIPTVAPAMLSRGFPDKKIMELMLTGDSISASEAMHLGLVNHVLPREDFEEEVRQFLGEMLLSNSRVVMQLIKKAGRIGGRLPVDEAIGNIERIYLTELMGTKDVEEGLSAHIEKRLPIWKDE